MTTDEQIRRRLTLLGKSLQLRARITDRCRALVKEIRELERQRDAEDVA